MPDRLFLVRYRLKAFHSGDGVAEAVVPSKFGEADPRRWSLGLGVSCFGCNNSAGSGDKSATPADLQTGLAEQVDTETPADPDTIARPTLEMKARTFVVLNANDFAQAVSRIEKFSHSRLTS